MAKKKKKAVKERFLRFCPKCKSNEVSMEKSNPLFGAYGLPANYVCSGCGYSGKVFPEVKASKFKELKKSIAGKPNQELKSNLVDSSYGDFVVRVWWKFMGPAAIIFGLISLYLWFNSTNPRRGLVLLIVSLFVFVLGAVTTYFSYFKRHKK